MEFDWSAINTALLIAAISGGVGYALRQNRLVIELRTLLLGINGTPGLVSEVHDLRQELTELNGNVVKLTERMRIMEPRSVRRDSTP